MLDLVDSRRAEEWVWAQLMNVLTSILMERSMQASSEPGFWWEIRVLEEWHLSTFQDSLGSEHAMVFLSCLRPSLRGVFRARGGP
jgi:hypothetical protein